MGRDVAVTVNELLLQTSLFMYMYSRNLYVESGTRDFENTYMTDRTVMCM